METISRISSMLETARELTLEAAQSAAMSRGTGIGTSSRNSSVSHIKKLLDSRSDRDVLDGMRQIISLMYRPEPSNPFFSAVVKNVASANLEVKKLVYIYLVHHAEAEPDLALLSINAIQKSLTDQNPQARAMALRTMSSIRVPVINQIVSLAIKRGCSDMSPHVRKAAALSIPKCYRLDPSTQPQLVGYISTLLGDSQYFVAGPAVSAFLEVCPDRIDLIHKHYRGLVKKLVDMDEWGQLATMRLMTFYARKCFPLMTKKVQRSQTKPKGFYDDDDNTDNVGDQDTYDVPIVDPELDLLLRSCKLLLQSRNAAVIIAVVRCFLYLAPAEYLASAVGPLVALLRSPQDMQLIALYNVVVVALRYPKPFTKYLSHFLVHASDPSHIWHLKLEVLTILFPHCGDHFKGLIISELEHFAQGADPDLVRESVRALGRCAQGDPNTSDKCLRILLHQITSLDDNLVSESLTVIRHLIQQDPTSHEQTVIQLVKHLGLTTNPDARATIVWLVGEYAGLEPERSFAPDVLQILVQNYADESEPVKQQVLLLGAKVYLHHVLRNPRKEEPQSEPKAQQQLNNEWADDQNGEEHDANGADEKENAAEEEDAISLLWRYILLLARYDTSYDLRDRARLYKALLSSPSSNQIANLLLLAPKPVPHAPSPSETRKDLLIGSSTLVLGFDAGVHGLRGYENLPDWVEAGQEPDSSLRESEIKLDKPGTAATTAGEQLDKVLREHEMSVAASNRAHPSGVKGAAPVPKSKSLAQWLDEPESETEDETEYEEVTDSDEEEEEEEEEEEGSTDEEYETDEEEEESEEEMDSDEREQARQLLA
ncbi:adaptin N terminal region-domain-containing protein [Aspergillus cavernicola]|uniref:Adaptin N terminal region-domain-containing protein n=1 Tax=Aspergillus cavernicola TaxID=176166 RepID=A0ABR4ISL9_9EURO